MSYVCGAINAGLAGRLTGEALTHKGYKEWIYICMYYIYNIHIVVSIHTKIYLSYQRIVGIILLFDVPLIENPFDRFA